MRHTRNHAASASPAVRVLTLSFYAATVLALASAAPAAPIVFATGTQNLTAAGHTYAESASASFTISTHSITVQLLNLVANPADLDQALGSLRFTVNGVTGTTSGMTETDSFSDFRINSVGGLTNVTNRTSTLWQTTETLQGNALLVTLCTVCASGGGSATELILGGPNGTNGVTGSYAAADFKSSGQWVIGSGLTYTSGALRNHNTTPTWTINLPNMNLSTVVINNAIFGFGQSSSGYGWDTFTVPQETPEPSQIILFGTGLGLIALGIGIRRWRQS